MTMTATHKCACHCGTVQFEADLPDILQPSRCNCSICAMKGAVVVYVALDQVRVTSGEDALSCYQFNTKVAKHYFCSNCGIHCFHQARSDPDKYGINVSCIEGMGPYDFAEIPVNDGINHTLDNNGVRRRAGMLRFDKTGD